MAPVIIDNLHKFGLDFQVKIIASILTDKSFLERVVDIIEVEAFENSAHQWILKEIIHYQNDYKELPTMQVFKVRVDTIENAELKESVTEQLRRVYNKVSETDLQFVREQFLEFCKNQKLKGAIMESVDHLQSGQYDRIKALIDRAMKAGMERNLGHNYHKEVAGRMSEMCRKTISTGWELELNENYVGLRYDCCFTGIDFQEIKHRQNDVEEAIKKIEGKLFVKYFPLKTVSAQSLKFHIERIQALEGMKIDEMIVDYADILRPLEKDSNSNSYSEAGGIYEELRQAAGELQIPVWTASQTNRSGGQEDVVQAHNIADSYRKIMTADFVISVSRNTNDKANNTARCHVIKNRFGPDGITLYARMDTSKGQIELYDSKSSESMQIQAEMQDSDNSVKNTLRSKWNASRQKENGENAYL